MEAAFYPVRRPLSATQLRRGARQSFAWRLGPYAICDIKYRILHISCWSGFQQENGRQENGYGIRLTNTPPTRVPAIKSSPLTVSEVT